MNKILIIAGPTASGKTEFAIKCAQEFNGEIISADSMQIYKKLNIGTAKPSKEETKQAVHHLIDFVDPGENFSVQQYVSCAKTEIDNIISRGKLPIIVGGTGLYIKSLIYPYSFAQSPKNEDLRNELKKLAEEKGIDYIYSLLETKDPESAYKIHPRDTKRVIRALEICMSTGKKKSELNTEENKKEYDYLMLVLSPDRKILYDKINNRVDKMFDLGLEEEIKTLVNNKEVSKESQCMQAIGYKEFFDYFENNTTYEELKESIKKHSRNYAKRQITFFRGFEDAIWLNDEDSKTKSFLAIKQFIKNEGE